MKLLIITQKVDLEDDLLGFFNGWIKEFAKNFERVFVITLAKGEYDLPGNVEIFSLGKEKGTVKLIQALKFFKLLVRYTRRCDGVFAHMSPLFALSAWPFTKIFRKKLVFWYLHRSSSFKAQLAARLSDFVATASKESLRIRGRNIIEVGHGINSDLFKTERNLAPGKPTNIISVGRISPIKGFETLIKAIKIVLETKIGVNLKIIGRPVMRGDEDYLLKLKKMTSDLNLDGSIQFKGFAPYKIMPAVYREADLSVNLAPKGGIDKVVLESMASGLLVLTSNDAFKKYFGKYNSILLFEHGNSVDLAEKIKHLISLPPEEKQKISQFLVQSVKEHHSLQETIGRLSDLIKTAHVQFF